MPKPNEMLNTRNVRPRPALPVKHADARDFMLIAFECDHCGGTFVAKSDPRTWRETLRCKCGHQIVITKHRHARGKCKKCRSPFYNMIVVNDLMRIRCRNCKSDIDLFVGRDGRFTA